MSLTNDERMRNAPKSLLAAAVLLALAGSADAQAQNAGAPAGAEDAAADDAAQPSGLEVIDDPLRVLPNEVSASSFGFAKPLLETPRSVSFVSQETIELYGLSSVEDLGRVTPSVYTASRYGIQGSVDVRGIPADTYIRGMKRISLQGHTRSVLAAMDSIEVVKGPPSPIFGMGKIGGYTNFVPKSGRSQISGYLQEPQGFAQVIGGSFSREEFSAGIGGPMTMFGKNGGYYLYGLLEDSESYYIATPYEQKIVQAAASLDRAIGRFRVETGANYQQAFTAGALSSRVTQDLVDNGRYIRGTALANLDLNSNGVIGFLEMHEASPVQGRLSGGNQPLLQDWAWPTDADGNPLALEDFPKVPGIPESMYNYLVDACGGVAATGPDCPDPTGLLRAQGIGGPLPISGYVPISFALDPRTVGFATLDDEHRRRASAHERELEANLFTAYFDLVYDEDPSFTMKNQLFFDAMDQYKASNQPLYLTIDSQVVENKFTLTKRLLKTPSWLSVNNLVSVNVRRTQSRTKTGTNGDFDRARVDILDPNWVDAYAGKTANTMFRSTRDNTDFASDGMPYSAGGKTTSLEYGVGALWDIDIHGKINLLVGGRYDYSKARNIEDAGTYNLNTGTSANPGALRTSATRAEGRDSGTSWSVSLSYSAGPGVRPYITMAESSLSLDGSNNRIGNAVIAAGHIGQAELKEYGVKTSMRGDSMFLTVARFEQSRISITEDPDDPTLSADVTATIGRGTEAEFKWIPKRGLTLSLFALQQETKFTPNTGGSFHLDARALGFVDVVDPNTGEVIYPAEAFLYGGQTRIVLPDGLPQYEVRPTVPEHQAGGTLSYQLQRSTGFGAGLGFTVSGNYVSDVCSGRLCLITLPSVTTYNAGVFKKIGNVDMKIDVTNLTDERYYRPRLYFAAADVLLNAMPGRRYAVTFKASFQ